MKSTHLKAIFATALFSAVILSAQSAEACSAFIIGKDLTEDGTYLFGRTEDFPFQEENAEHNKNFIVHEAADYSNGEVLHDGDTGFTYPHAEHEMKYTAVPDAERDEGENLNGTYGAHGFNEAGVSMSATVTTTPNKWQTGNWKKIAKEDPFFKYEPFFKEYYKEYDTAYQAELDAGQTPEEAEQKADQAAYYKAQNITEEKQGGLGESSMIDLVLPRARTAREGIETIAKAIDEHGAYDGNTIVIADKKELWYMEILSGHEYVAIKYPADKFSVFPNTYFLGSVDFSDKENVIASKNVEALAKRVGSATYDKDGNFLIARSYSTNDYAEANRSRVYAGIKLLDPKANISYDDPYYDFLRSPTDPSRKYSIRDAFEIQRNRFEHLPEYKPDDQMPETESKTWVNNDVEYSHPVYKYALGNKNVIDPHIYQVNPDLPEGFGGVAWMALGQSRNTPYIPYYGNITKTPKEFHSQTTTYDGNSWYWTAQNIDKLVSEHYDLFGNTIQERWKALENAEIKRQNLQNSFYKTAGITSQEASENVTKDFLALAEVVFKEMKVVEDKIQLAIKGDKKALAYLKDFSTLPTLPELHLDKRYQVDPDPTSIEKPQLDLSQLSSHTSQVRPIHQQQTYLAKPVISPVAHPLKTQKAQAMPETTTNIKENTSPSLPKTGDKASSILASLGLSLLTLSSFFGKKHREKH
ncbi:C69 family dipeptidase [Streptococcus pneumoniae]